MSKPDAPAAPDYSELAGQQAIESSDLAAQQTAANRPDVSTPWGNLSYSTNGSSIDPATGAMVDNVSENVGLTPQEQESVTNQQNISAGETGTASNLLNTIGSQINQTPGTAPTTQSMTGAGQGMDYNPGQINQQAENAVWNQFQNMQEPLQQQQTQQQNAQLAAQGLKPGDAAYDTANTNLLNTQFSQDQTAEDQAVGAGEQEGATEFGEANAAQAQGYGQEGQQLEYNNAQIPQNIQNQEAELGLGQEQSGYDVNLLNGLLNGQQVGMPSFPGTTSAGSGTSPNLLQAGEDQEQAALDSYNAQTGSANSLMQGLGSAATTVGAAFAFSDEDMKTDIKRVGETDEGIPIHTYRFKGSPTTQMGVLAQQLRKKKPSAVAEDPMSGMLKVDYRKVG
jgi:hypothetical protein